MTLQLVFQDQLSTRVGAQLRLEFACIFVCLNESTKLTKILTVISNTDFIQLTYIDKVF